MDSLVKNGRVERGFMGVMIQNLTSPGIRWTARPVRWWEMVRAVPLTSRIEERRRDYSINGQPIEDASQLKLQWPNRLPVQTFR
jgi:hypothetical protein